MRHYYTNFTLLGVDANEVIAGARELGRSAFVVQRRAGRVVLYDQTCERQDTMEIKQLGGALSVRLRASVIACLNRDDDYLLFWVFTGGVKRASYKTWRHAAGFAWTLSRVRGGVLAYPLIVAVLGWPGYARQISRHRALVNLLALPEPAVGFGYRDLARGKLPPGLTPADLHEV